MENKVIIFCAPSGSGKTTIVKHLITVNDKLAFSISACTRRQRPGETDGRDYYFISHNEFKKKIANDEFLEYEEVYDGNFYGTLKSEIERIWSMGKVLIFDVDAIGGLNLKRYFGDKALTVFIKPPGIDVLNKRLRERSTETEETLKARIDKAELELGLEDKFDVVLVNDKLDEALIKAENLVNDFVKA